MQAPCCLNCGVEVELDVFREAAEEAQRRIAELEAQVKILSDKASAAGMLSYGSMKHART